MDVQGGREEEELAEIEAQTVNAKSVNADGLKSLRKNASEKMILVNLWATWCGPCFAELPELENMYRMYGHRPFDLVTVSINYPDEKPGVLTALKKLHATSTNLHFGSTDIYDLMAAFDPNLERRSALYDADQARRRGCLQASGIDQSARVATIYRRQSSRRRLPRAPELLEERCFQVRTALMALRA